MHYCNPDDRVEIPLFEIEFTNDANRLFWCAKINQLNNVAFPYTRGKEPFTCGVEHTPMKWNYWHFSLRWNTRFRSVRKFGTESKERMLQKELAIPREC